MSETVAPGQDRFEQRRKARASAAARAVAPPDPGLLHVFYPCSNGWRCASCSKTCRSDKQCRISARRRCPAKISLCARILRAAGVVSGSRVGSQECEPSLSTPVSTSVLPEDGGGRARTSSPSSTLGRSTLQQ
eukprot:2448716-Pyramimonas_sp.AAC.1